MSGGMPRVTFDGGGMGVYISLIRVWGYFISDTSRVYFCLKIVYS